MLYFAKCGKLQNVAKTHFLIFEFGWKQSEVIHYDSKGHGIVRFQHDDVLGVEAL